MGRKKFGYYDADFKRNAVELYLSGEKSLKKLGKEIGVPPSTFSKWIKEYDPHGQQAFPGKGHLKPEDKLLKDLRKEVEQVTRERDILKKALAIFSSAERKNMSL